MKPYFEATVEPGPNGDWEAYRTDDLGILYRVFRAFNKGSVISYLRANGYSIVTPTP